MASLLNYNSLNPQKIQLCKNIFTSRSKQFGFAINNDSIELLWPAFHLLTDSITRATVKSIRIAVNPCDISNTPNPEKKKMIYGEIIARLFTGSVFINSIPFPTLIPTLAEIQITPSEEDKGKGPYIILYKPEENAEKKDNIEINIAPASMTPVQLNLGIPTTETEDIQSADFLATISIDLLEVTSLGTFGY